ncbi:MAG: 4Fe-4S dicluster domain-containing protein [Caldithrix sp.]|nr:4Fe-4S dicluster domain-containing protein [Caldithrix sp.]
MGKQSRRDFLKTSGLIGAGLSGLSSKKAHSGVKKIIADDRMGVLVDTTLCIGCRRCEYACKGAHDIDPGRIEQYDDRSVFKEMRRPQYNAYTVVNEYTDPENPDNPSNVKVQCMHCDHPACLSACIVGAFSKEENGAVIWDEGKCIGCRYCMIACPFQIPQFEYHKALEPEIRKCDLCWESRTKDGGVPACVEICPMEALVYGKRYELLQLAHERIEKNPERYLDHVYGENEVGGTSWLYLAAQDFTKLDFPQLSDEPAPGASEKLQHAIFSYFIPPASLFALLGGIMWINRKQNTTEEE